uniref:Ankyrin repeat domain 33Bb n=1 Tax=Amazona collaria TaxID=241587 RepID=A0A8B9GCU4_9PSIT
FSPTATAGLRGAKGATARSPPPPLSPRQPLLPQDCEEYEDFSELPDTCSIASDDSFYPPGGLEDEEDQWSLEQEERDSPEALSLFRACCTNNTIVLKALIRQGPEEEEVRETDRNRRNGLIVACYQGYVDIVIALAQCPHLDVNWQDNEGNTALITAAQAGKALHFTSVTCRILEVSTSQHFGHITCSCSDDSISFLMLVAPNSAGL